MKLAILSDTHDHIWNLEKAISVVKEKSCEAIIHCGDFCAPFTAGNLGKAGLPIYAVFGNNDEDHYAFQRKLGEQFHGTALTEEFGKIEFDGKKIAYCHYPKLGELLAKSGEFDAVFFGHTHEVVNKYFEKSLLANPGSVCGIIKGQPAVASFMIYDTSKNKVELVEII